MLLRCRSRWRWLTGSIRAAVNVLSDRYASCYPSYFPALATFWLLPAPISSQLSVYRNGLSAFFCLSRSLSLWNSDARGRKYVLTHTLTITCTCCVDLTKGAQDKDFSYSFFDSLSGTQDKDFSYSFFDSLSATTIIYTWGCLVTSWSEPAAFNDELRQGYGLLTRSCKTL